MALGVPRRLDFYFNHSQKLILKRTKLSLSQLFSDKMDVDLFAGALFQED